MKNIKFKILVLVVVLGSLFYIFKSVVFHKTAPEDNQAQKIPTNTSSISQSDKPQIISIKPDPLDENIISATEVIEITFNRTIENIGEFKVKMEPETEYKTELSGDRKTARIIPLKPYQLGTTYTLFIGTETKFDGVGRWGEEKIFHFRTIKYTGV